MKKVTTEIGKIKYETEHKPGRKAKAWIWASSLEASDIPSQNLANGQHVP